MDTNNVADWQRGYLQEADRIEALAHTSPHPESLLEWAGTLRERTGLSIDSEEEITGDTEQEDKPVDTFMLGTRFSDMEQLDLDPVWPGYMYSGVVTGIIGDEGTGKSTLLSALAARVSKGLNGPDGTPTRKGTVIYISPEEFDEITVIDRLKREEADLQNVVSLRFVNGESFKLPTHIEALRRAIVHYKASLVVIDPINSCVGKGHTISTNPGARNVLEPLQNMLRESEAACVFITHFTKNTSSKKASHRGSGSQGLYDFLRVYLTLCVDETTGKVVLHQDKNNLLTGNTSKPADIYIEKLQSGRLFFSGVGGTPEFRTVTEEQRQSMGRQMIIKILDSDPLQDFPPGLIHQHMLETYPHMGSSTTRSLLLRMTTPRKDGTTDIGKTARGYYYSFKRAALLAELQKQETTEVTKVLDNSTSAIDEDDLQDTAERKAITKEQIAAYKTTVMQNGASQDIHTVKTMAI